MKPMLIFLFIFVIDFGRCLSQAKEKKLIVEVEPADYDNNVLESLREQEDVPSKKLFPFYLMC